MSRFKGRDTKPEVLVRKALHRNGRRFRLHRKDLPGKPDIALPALKTVVFVHGCFWHHHEGCREARVPQSNPSFWEEKFRSNKARDERVQEELRALGWRVVVIWECEAKGANLDDLLRREGLIGSTVDTRP
jgi:DNA mismatch endonuclease (patch repair protein)